MKKMTAYLICLLTISVLLPVRVYCQDPFVPSKVLKHGSKEGHKIDTEENSLRSVVVATAGQMKQFYGIDLKQDELAIANIKIDGVFYVAVTKDNRIKQVNAISSHVADVGPFEMRHSALRYNFEDPVVLIPQDKSAGLKNKTTNNLTISVFMVGDELNEADERKVGSKPNETINSTQSMIFMGYSEKSYFKMQYDSQMKTYLNKNIEIKDQPPFVFRPALQVGLQVDSETRTEILHLNLKESSKLSYEQPYHLFYRNCHTATCGILGKLPKNKSYCGTMKEFMGKMNPSRFMDYLKGRGLVSPSAIWSAI